MPDLEKIVAEQLQRFVPAGAPLMVAVSGGLDSVVLMHLLAAVIPTPRKIWVTHFDHQLRGTESRKDALFVSAQAKKLRLRFVGGKGDAAAFAGRKKLSIEMAARELRHRFFAEAGRKRGIHHLLLAHHADDQHELFFLRLLRGAGPEGLSGMRSCSRSPLDRGLTLVRPLLEVGRAEVAAYAAAHQIKHREDLSNRSHRFLRNKIRHQLMPLLEKQYQPSLRTLTLRTMELIRSENEWIEEQARQWLAKGEGKFSELHPSLQRAVLKCEIQKAGVPVDFSLIETIRCHPGAVAGASGGKILRQNNGRVSVVAPNAEFRADSLWVDLNSAPHDIRFGEGEVRWSVQSGRGVAGLNRKPAAEEWFDADRVGSPIQLRHWQPGDRFCPIGMKTAVKLQDLLTNAKVSRTEKRSRVVATTATGDIFWVQGLRIGERYKLDKRSSRRLKWAWFVPQPARKNTVRRKAKFHGRDQ